MTRDHAEASEQEQGVVIVAVLWILMALSALAMIFSIYLSASARSLALDDAALQAEALVSASVELSAYQLTLAGDAQRPPRGSFHFRMTRTGSSDGVPVPRRATTTRKPSTRRRD
jgi:general secretion pathway protein K